MVVDSPGETAQSNLQNTDSDDVDSGGQSSWIIANSSVFRAATGVSSWASFDESKQIAIKGYARTATNTPATGAQTITPAAWMARFGRTVADQVLGAVEDRMSAPRSPGTEISLAGHRIVSTDPYTDDTGRAGRESFGWSEVEMESRGITRREMLTFVLHADGGLGRGRLRFAVGPGAVSDSTVRW